MVAGDQGCGNQGGVTTTRSPTLPQGGGSNGIGQAGPITQTVTDAAAYTSGTMTRFTIDSTKYASSFGESVTFTVVVPET